MNAQDLYLLEDWITTAEEESLISLLDNLPWSGNGQSPNAQIKRRMQQYGALFQMDSRTFCTKSSPAPIPQFLSVLADRLTEKLQLPQGHFNYIVCNEYKVGQGICAHVDALVFGPVICMLSLISPCVMEFTPVVSDCCSAESLVKIVLQPRSCCVLRGEARYSWKHAISKREVEIGPLGEEIVRGRRISVIFRSICPSETLLSKGE